MDLATCTLQPSLLQLVSALSLLVFSFLRWYDGCGISINLPEEIFHSQWIASEYVTDFFLSSLYSNGLDVLLNNRDYLWYKSFQCHCTQRKVWRQGHSLLWMPDTTPISSNKYYAYDCCFSWSRALLLHREEPLPSITSPSTLAYLLFSLNNFPSKKVETFHCLSLTNRSFFNNRHKVFQSW